MQIAVVGTGFVGVVSAAVFAKIGHTVVGIDIVEDKIAQLQRSEVPFYEPDLPELLTAGQEAGLLSFTTEYAVGIPNADVVVVAVGTPSRPDGSANLEYVYSACASLAPHLKDSSIVAIKSTVPSGTFTELRSHIAQHTSVNFALASLPEFLREGSAVADTLSADRVVIGVDEDWARARLTELHQPLGAPIEVMAAESAQLTKYAANAYLATRITFINQIANLCEAAGADIQDVIRGMGHDKRIGHHYWYPGLGYGGSCFPKDVKELAHFSETHGGVAPLFHTINTLNQQRMRQVYAHLGSEVGGWKDKQVAFLGLAFKPHTDDLREAPSTYFIPWLLTDGAQVVGYDPKALPVAQATLPQHQHLSFSDSLAQTCTGADVILAVIEWPEILTHDFSTAREAHRTQFFIDIRNQFDPATIASFGFEYRGIGRTHG